MAEEINVRLLALETLLESEKKNLYVKESLNRTLFQHQFLSKQDRAFLSRLVEGVTEYQVRLDYIINSFSKIKVNKCKPVIRMILRMGVYQMLYMDSVPRETACDECVKLAKKKGFHQLRGFVNGVLRSVAREVDSLKYPKESDNLSLSLSVEYSMPEWLVKELLHWYGKDLTRKILNGCVETKNLSVRVNEERVSVEELKNKMLEKGIDVQAGNYVPEVLHLSNINYVRRLPGFKEGEFFVQDESSMLLCHLMKPWMDQKVDGLALDDRIKVLDLCAAPGGKSTHFAEYLGKKGQIESRDLTADKISLIEENIERLQLDNITTKVSDAVSFDETKKEWADIVIADLPCSGLGIMGRKNDIKYHVTKEQLGELITLQRSILENAVRYVKPGGVLLFSTCTIHPGENQENAKWIIENLDVKPYEISNLLPDSLRDSIVEPNMIQTIQGRESCDGFFIAAFEK